MDEARIIAWLDGALPADEARALAAAVAADPVLAATAEAHRNLKARFASAFESIASEPVELPAAPAAEIVTLADVRAARAERALARSRWMLPGAIAASLVAGVFGGQQLVGTKGIGDTGGSLAVAGPIARALESQRSGEVGPIRVALTFRDHAGAYCRSFTGERIEGVACRGGTGWLLRYAAPATSPKGDYRMAGDDVSKASLIEAMMAGEPLGPVEEAEAARKGWQSPTSK